MPNKESKERHRNHTCFVHSHMRYRRFNRLRKENRDPVTKTGTMTQKRTGGMIRQPLQLIKRILNRPPTAVRAYEREAPATIGPLALVACVDTDVVVCSNIPLKVRYDTPRKPALPGSSPPPLSKYPCA